MRRREDICLYHPLKQGKNGLNADYNSFGYVVYFVVSYV